MGAQMQHKARPQVGRPNATQGTSASWGPKLHPNANARHVRHRKLGAATQRKARRKMVAQTQKRNENVHTRGTRLKDELEDG
jgi:hypothetical protein